MDEENLALVEKLKARVPHVEHDAFDSRLEELLSVRVAIKTEVLTVLVPQASGKFRLTCAAPVKS